MWNHLFAINRVGNVFEHERNVYEMVLAKLLSVV